MAEENSTENASEALDLSGLGSFEFAPSWAKGDPGDKSKFRRFEGRDESRDEGRQRGRDDRPRSPRGDSSAPRGRGDRPGFQRMGGDRPRRPAGEDRPPMRRDDRPPRRESGDAPRRFGDRSPRREFTKPMDAEVRLLPNQKDLGGIVRKVQTSHLAYPLKQLAFLFLDNPASCIVRVTPKGEGVPMFHSCKACGFATMDESALMAHLVAKHLSDYYVAEEIECDPPAGQFPCVAKCGLSGELLGPPNLHGYEARIREMIRTRYPNMSEAAYRARIEMVRDPEVVEAWRKSATKKTVFRAKGATPPEGADAVPGVDRETAEAEFRRTIAPGLVSTSKTADIPGDLAMNADDRSLAFACRDAFQRERRFPASLFFALRGAFHHRKLAFFRANEPRGPEFVSAVAPSPLDAEHAVAELADIVRWVEAHPCCTRAEIVAAIAGADEKKRAATLTHLAWLAEKGHVVAYFNGTFAVAAKNPKYRGIPKNAPAKKEAPAQEAPAASPAPEAESPAPVEETPAPASEAPAPAAEAPAPVEETPAPAAEAPAPAEETPAPAAPVEEVLENKEEVKKDEAAPQLAE